jgi:hypothetical protein
LIKVIPNENQDIVVYRGQVATDIATSEPGDPALIIDGTRVPYDEFDAWYTERMLFDWRGQPFKLWRYRDGRVDGAFIGNDLTWPQDKGLAGNRNDGWFLNVTESEIENLRIEKIDILERQRYRQTFKVNPPEDLFTYVRPATDQEWIRE